jgi:hypothetical protein
MTTCVSTQILWDADNAKMSGELRQRTLRFCEEAQPCPLISAEERILQVSSQRDLTSAPHSTAPVAQASFTAILTRRSIRGPARAAGKAGCTSIEYSSRLRVVIDGARPPPWRRVGSPG